MFSDLVLFQYDALLFRNVNISPEQQYALTKVQYRTVISLTHTSACTVDTPSHHLIPHKRLRPSHYTPQAFDPTSEAYGHGNNKTQSTKKSILHPDLKTIPRVPQVQLIGNGTVHNHEGLESAALKHPSHTTFHKTPVSPQDEAKGVTRFYRWHIDAALYDLSPPKVTTLYGIQIPQGPKQTCRYDDGTGDTLPVPLGTTAFVSGKTMFDILPRELQSVAVRARVRYAPHPYEWMTPAAAHSTGLKIESEGKEVPLNELTPWSEDKVKVFPVVRPLSPLAPPGSYAPRRRGRTL
jgi:hypothetical protein